MHIFRLSFAALVLVTFSPSVIAQRRPATAAPKPATPQASATTTSAVPAMKIALIDTSAFGDEKEGIIRFRDAVKSLQREFKPAEAEIQNLQTRIDAIAEEVKKLKQAAVVAPESITAKEQEGERLVLERKKKQEQGQQDFQKRYGEVADPISRDIGNALTRFAEQRGVTLTLDASKFMPAILTMHPALDLTREFIADYNSKNPATSTQPQP